MKIKNISKKEFEFYLNNFKQEKYFAAIKAGGGCLDNSLINSLQTLHELGLNPILIHGGGNQIDLEMKKEGIAIEKFKGKRITNEKTMDIVKKVMDKINEELIYKLNFGKVRAEGFKEIFYITKQCPIYGYSGKANGLDKEKIKNCLDQKIIPVISSIGIDHENHFYNLNADSAFRTIVEEFNPGKVIFLTPIGGVFREGNLISKIKFSELEELLDSNFIDGGMRVKLEEIKEIVKIGKNVQITSPKFLLEELFSKKGKGTYIHSD